MGEDDRLVGILSDRDIAVRAVARGKAPDRCTVGEVMSHDVKYIYDDETLEDASRNMSELKVRRLPVLNRKKRLVRHRLAGRSGAQREGQRAGAEVMASFTAGMGMI